MAKSCANKFYKKYLHDNKGSALVEFAILSSVAILIIFGSISYGIALYNSILIEQSTKIGARAGVVSVISKKGIQSLPPGCSLDFTSIEGLSQDAESTASCVVYNFLSNRLISIYNKNPPIISAESIPNSCEPSPSCYLKVRVEFNNTGIFVFNSLKSSAETIMFYE